MSADPLRWRLLVNPQRPKGMHLEVRLYPTRADMLAALTLEATAAGVSDPVMDPRTAGLMQTYLWRQKRGRCLGNVSFNREDLDLDTIVHELAHCAFAIAAYKGVELFLARRDKAWREEERYCYILGYLVSQFVADLDVRGLLPHSETAA